MRKQGQGAALDPPGAGAPGPAIARRDLLLGLAGTATLALLPQLPPPRIRLFAFAIAGGWHHSLGDALPWLAEGVTLDVRPEFDNPNDPDAIAIHMPRTAPLAGQRVGYLPRLHNAAPARLLRRAAVLRATVFAHLGETRAILPPDLAFTSCTGGDPLLHLILEG